MGATPTAPWYISKVAETTPSSSTTLTAFSSDTSPSMEHYRLPSHHRCVSALLCYLTIHHFWDTPASLTCKIRLDASFTGLPWLQMLNAYSANAKVAHGTIRHTAISANFIFSSNRTPRTHRDGYLWTVA